MTAVIAVDVRRNTWAPEYGISRYVRNLVRALREVAAPDLQVRPLDIAGSHVWGTHASVSVGPSGHSMLSRMCQEQVGMRRLDEVDALHLPWYEGPLWPGVTHVVNVHDLDTLVAASTYRWRFRAYYNALLRAYVRTADRIIVPSRATAEAVLARWPRVTLDVVPYGIDPIFSPGDPSLTKPQRVLYTGGYGPRKRVADLLAAFDRLADDRPRLELVMTGAPLPAAQAMIAAGRHAERVHVTGILSDEDLASLYRSAGVVAYPSMLEGFGFPVLEAFASGVPLVTTRSGSIPELAEGASVLVDPGDVDSLAEAIATTLDDSSLAAKLIESGLRRVADYRWECVALQTVAVYRAALNP